MDLQVEEVAYHRNGISGEGFVVITFTQNVDGKVQHMVGVVFPGAPGDCRTAVFDRELLGQGVIAFFENSWRGDHYDSFLRAAAKDADYDLTDNHQSAMIKGSGEEIP